jgi:hypothetical protein
MTSPRLLSLFVLSNLALQQAFACTTTVIPTNQQLFRGSVRVYEATALSSDLVFEVTRVWQGDDRDVIELQWPKDHPCETLGATQIGETYLVVISCEDPDDGDIASCPAWFEPLESADHRLRYLTASETLWPSELAERLKAWLEGRESTDDLARWVSRMNDVAEVTDWFDLDGSEWSLTLGILLELDSQLNERGVPISELQCEIGHLRSRAVPMSIEMLGVPNPTEEELDALEEAYDEAELSCP